jgi:hypothetical protein
MKVKLNVPLLKKPSLEISQFNPFTLGKPEENIPTQVP